MLPGFSGDLVSEYFAEELLAQSFAGELGEATREEGRRTLAAWWRSAGSRLGPASAIRKVFDLGAVPIVNALGYQASNPRPSRIDGLLTADLNTGKEPLPLVVAAWGEPLDRAWSDVARAGVRMDAPWVVSFNGRELRLSDCQRLHARRHAAFDLETSVGHRAVFAVFWCLMRASALIRPEDAQASTTSPISSILDRVVAESARHAVRVCSTLRVGVRESLTHLLQGLVSSTRRAGPRAVTERRLAWTYDQALTLVYRVLFLLFAEARGLVPVWHPIYRDGYTVASLCEQAEQPGRATGLWEGLQAISRLAHAGCIAGDLRVTPFNGRLFAPRRAPLAETRRVDDELVRRAVLSVATQPGRTGRQRVAFRDLGVEQLGSVYESVLDFVPSVEKVQSESSKAVSPRKVNWQVSLVGQGDRRKASGTFYTPRSITEYLVRRTLYPLVDGAASNAILGLRLLDPAMGSGAFLVAACRYLAAAYESAVIREGACHTADIAEADRAGFRRLVAERCLYGVDLNPVAVQVARLSVWLTTLASDKPLTFLDHHLAAGDSLVGASLDDLVRRPVLRRGRAAPSATLPIFDGLDVGAALRAVLPIRQRLAEPDDNVSVVHEKERLLAGLGSADLSLADWKTAADLWCSRWFWNRETSAAPSAQEVGDLIARLVGKGSGLPEHLAAPQLRQSRQLAERLRFFHWTLEFPEVFFDGDGTPKSEAGFDAVVGNPPWDMIRGDAGDEEGRSERRHAAGQLTRFVRESGVYKANGEGHANRYQLFVERSLRLVRRDGRVGLVLPWGLASDAGCAELRRLIVERCRTDALVSFENSESIFPIHRGVRFLLLTTSPGGPSTRIPCLFGARDPAVLENIPDQNGEHAGKIFPVSLSPELLRRMSGPDLAIPHLRNQQDLAIAEKLTASHPSLGDDQKGWGAQFGRELNATEDRRLFRDHGALPIVEGKHIDPFKVHVERCTRFVARLADLPSLRLQQSCRHARLAYRDVAASTNRLTLIAAIVPAGAITVHTLFCLRTPLDPDEQAFLCGMLNSFVANYLVRLRVTTHLGVAGVERLPVPRPPRSSSEFGRIVALVGMLTGRDAGVGVTFARLQAKVARLYGLSVTEFRHLLETFPLVSRDIRDQSLGEYAGPSANE